MRTAREVTLPLSVDRAAAAEPLPQQLVRGVRELLAQGILAPDDPMPATRVLAGQVGVSRGTVVAAYEQLLAEGWLVASGGRDTRVNPKLQAVRPQATPAPRLAAAARTPALLDLRPGRPHQTEVVGPAWRSAWRRAADAPVDVPDVRLGWPPLREAITEHLRRMRAVVRPAEEVAITAGGREGLALLLTATGVRSVGVEDPGYPSLRRVLAAAGVRLVSLPTDAHGLITEALPEEAPELIVVTPSHQYPLGGSLPIDRRQQLLDWAAGHAVWVVEDDYDSELRYTSEPLPALTAMDTDGRVTLLGTFSKTLTPALATGFLVVSPALIPTVTRVRADLGMPVGLVNQRALAYFLESGALTRHTQRMRQLYRRRRDLVVHALQDVAGIAVHPMDGGLHAVIEFDRDEAEVLAALEELGVRASALSEYWSGAAARVGLVFGFGGVTESELRQGLAAIVRVLEPRDPMRRGGHQSF